jgi:hypothetical protein
MQRFVLATLLVATASACGQGLMAPVRTLAPMANAGTTSASITSNQGVSQAIAAAANTEFRRADWNSDGFLEPNEPHHMSSTEYARADVNKDYRLSLVEWLAYFKRQEPEFIRIFRVQAERSFMQADLNGDKSVTMPEFQATQAIEPNPYPYPCPTAMPTAIPSTPDARRTVSPQPLPSATSYPPNPYPGPAYPCQPVIDPSTLSMLFNLSDANHDRKLDFSEFEDYLAWKEVSKIDNGYPYPVYPQPANPSAMPTPSSLPRRSA